MKAMQHRSVTAGLEGNKTDATFFPDGRFLFYSGEAPGLGGENVLVLPIEGGQTIPMTCHHGGYHGAPSWSPDGAYLAIEASARPPDGTAGTALIITPVHGSAVQQPFESR
jgi:TolB protein